MKEAMFWEAAKDGAVVCHLCGRHCRIAPAERGVCGTRENREGTLYSVAYGRITAPAADPIEKKPLYHFKPGSLALSFGTAGCNFRCMYCQNATLARAAPETSYLTTCAVEEVVRTALDHDGIAWTYNEPTVGFEFSYDVSKQYKEAGGGYVCYVTNGYIEREPLQAIAPYLDAVNIDIKSITEGFYRDIVGARLQRVLDTAVQARDHGIHVEVTYLVVPHHNDSEEELAGFSRWVAEHLGPDTATHFSRFFPAHKMRTVPPTPVATMERAREIATAEGLSFVYLGNIQADNDTRCPQCGRTIIRRSAFTTTKPELRAGACPDCGRAIPIVT